MSNQTSNPVSSGIFSQLVKYRNFLLEPGTLFTLASGTLLIVATLAWPQARFRKAA
jgi:Zn2+/Cd2+-exporting ATPase